MNWYKKAQNNKNITEYPEEEEWDDYEEEKWVDEEEKEKWEEQRFQSEFSSPTEEETLALSETKVVDESGKPLTVYHGTDAKFDQFQYTDSYRYVLFSRFPVKTKGFFFSPSFKDAKEYGKNVIPAKLNMKNPLLDGSAGVDRVSPELEKELAYILEPMVEVDDQGRENIDIGIQKHYIDRNDPMWVYYAIEGGKLVWDAADNDAVVERMRERGYDGTLVQESNDYSGTSYFVLNPEQVVSLNKSAKVNMNWYKNIKIAATASELRQIGVEVNRGIATLYRGSNVPNLTKKDLRYGDYLSSVPSGSDATGNAGADSYGKHVETYYIPVEEIKITNGELQYVGNSNSLEGEKYPLEIYQAYNDYYGSNYTSKEIDNMEYSHVRSVASMALGEGKDEFNMLMRRKNELV